MTRNHKAQYAQTIYLSHYLGATLAHTLKLLISLPFRPTHTASLLHNMEFLLNGEIEFIQAEVSI